MHSIYPCIWVKIVFFFRAIKNSLDKEKIKDEKLNSGFKRSQGTYYFSFIINYYFKKPIIVLS